MSPEQQQMGLIGGSGYEPFRLADQRQVDKWGKPHQAINEMVVSSRFNQDGIGELMTEVKVKGTISKWQTGKLSPPAKHIDDLIEITRSQAYLQYLCERFATREFVEWLCGRFGGRFDADPVEAEKAQLRARLNQLENCA